VTDESKSTQIAIFSVESTPLDFPPPSAFVTEDYAMKVRAAIQKYGVYEGNGKTAVHVAALQDMLSTDLVGAKKFYNGLPNADKFKDGHERYVRTPALKREYTERIEKAFDAKKIEQYREADSCLSALRDNPTSRTIRGIAEVEIRAGQKHLKQQKIERDNITACERTGEPLEPNAHAHHKIRKADDPDQALNLDNIEVMNEDPHVAHHANERKIDFD